MTDIQTPQGRVVTVLRRTAGEVEVPQAYVVSILNFPAEAIQAAQSRQIAVFRQVADIQAAQARVVLVGRGQVENSRIRAWAYSMDGHGFYVLRLGNQRTLIYDTATQQWASWDGTGLPYWRAHLGLNWMGMTKAGFDNGNATEIVAGDDSYGILWTLDPEQGYDEPIDEGSDSVEIVRAVRGGVPFRGRTRSRTNGVWLTVSTGAPTIPLAAITLRTSDDQGRTWQDRGNVTVIPADYTQTIYWRSLGLMTRPGRLFEFEDDGAMIRIDGADIDMTGDDQ